MRHHNIFQITVTVLLANEDDRRWSKNVLISIQSCGTICPDIRRFQIPVKTSCTGHSWRKTKDFFVFCSEKNLLGIVSWFLFFCFTSSVSGLSATQSSHYSHPLHPLITWIYPVNVKCGKDWSDTKPYICLSFNFLKQYFANETCFTEVKT